MTNERDAQTRPKETPSEEPFVPRSILIFLSIMFIGYVLYWAYVWFVTVIQRGG
jgi:hypothetical protein